MRLYDKLAILLIITACTTTLDGTIMPVVLSLAALIAAMLTEMLPNRRFAAAVSVGAAAACFFVPRICIALPITAYDIVKNRSKELAVIYAAALVSVFTCGETETGIMCAVGTVIAVYLEICAEKRERSEKLLHEVRDNSEELNLLLRDKNASLIKLRDSEVYSATLRERNRIAREIHDNVGHMLTRCLLQVGALSVITKDELTREKLKDVQQTLDSAMTSIRRSVHDLHDESIDLKTSVADIVNGAKERFRVSLDYDISETVSGDIKLAFIGILKEAVNNAVKYSNGDKLRVSVQEYPGFCRLTVMDNGTAAVNLDSHGIGLENMQERARKLGGSFTAEPTEKGFRVFVSVPK